MVSSKVLTTLMEKAFGNIVGKGENAGNQHFLLFLQCFMSYPKRAYFFPEAHSICCLRMVSTLTCLEFCRGVKGYPKVKQTADEKINLTQKL